ncbi:MAG: calcium/sodium antiporter [Puniceicoccales bacterium]|jgi:cation:H+ antiporter|nr:calcium/sodium antiporter [Puniceicoccales bacterium]
MWGSFWLAILGFVLLIYGGDRVCVGASALAVRLGVNQFIIGMTVVAISTSAPELITSLLAMANGHPEIIAGNVIGSNLVNIGLAGGFVALVKPFMITARTIPSEASFLFFVTCLFGIFSIFSPFGGGMGMVLVILNVLYLYFICKNGWSVKGAKGGASGISVEIDIWRALWIFAFGLVLLFIGAQLVIDSSVKIAHGLGWSDALIGFTLIAIGTSFPEIAVSLVAAVRGYGAICAGNIIGSNIFNTLMIVGCCAVLGSVPVEVGLYRIGVPSLIFLTALIWRFFTTKREIGRLEGAVLFFIFLGIFTYFVRRQLPVASFCHQLPVV